MKMRALVATFLLVALSAGCSKAPKERAQYLAR